MISIRIERRCSSLKGNNRPLLSDGVGNLVKRIKVQTNCKMPVQTIRANLMISI